MPMTKDDLSRAFYLTVTADGAVFILGKAELAAVGLWSAPWLPVFTTDTHEEAEMLRVRHCRLDYDPVLQQSVYRLNQPPAGVEDLGRVSELFRKSYVSSRKRKAS